MKLHQPILLTWIVLSVMLSLWPRSAAAVPTATEARKQVDRVRKTESQVCATEQRAQVFKQIQDTINKGQCFVEFFPVDCKLKRDQNDELLSYLKHRGYDIRPGFNLPSKEVYIDWCKVSKHGEPVDDN